MFLSWLIFMLISIYTTKCTKITKCITMKHIKNTKKTTNNHDYLPNKQEQCIWKTIYRFFFWPRFQKHGPGNRFHENHVKNAWKSRWISQFSLKIFHNTITHCLCCISVLLSWKLRLCLWNSVCRIFFFCKTRLFIMLIVMFLWTSLCVSWYLCCVSARLFFCVSCRIYFLFVVLYKPCKRHWKYEITHIIQKWWIIFDSKTLVRNRDRTNTTITNQKYCVSFWKT